MPVCGIYLPPRTTSSVLWHWARCRRSRRPTGSERRSKGHRAKRASRIRAPSALVCAHRHGRDRCA
eukprot:scaffold234184_cov37-Tisochrysis_lutea.AAC.4